MIKLTIDNRSVEVPAGTSVWKAAQSVGIEIPTLCYLEGTEHFTSCMICLVKDAQNSRLFASCSTPVAEGQVVITNDQETNESRKVALELLLSEHVGDCEAPCQLVCPAHMNIPLMNRLIAKGDFVQALEVVKRDIALPSILGRICPAPCEAGCRRKQVDEAVSICLLKRFVGDEDLKSKKPYQSQLAELSGKKVAVIGAGPAGLAAAYYLQIKGHQVVIFEKNGMVGGELLQIDQSILPNEVVVQEVGLGVDSVIAALLHNVYYQASTTKLIEPRFGRSVTSILEGMAKINSMGTDTVELHSENYRKLMLAMAGDVRVILVKIADRLQVMRNLDAQPESVRTKISVETSFLYAPLAHRLGVYYINSELLDL